MNEIADLIQIALSWRTLVGAVVLFSLIPGVALHLGVLLYPRDHPRRPELVAELKAVPRRERPFWVVETLVGVAFEAIPLRVEQIRRRRSADDVRGRGVILSAGVLLGGFVLTDLPTVSVIGLIVLAGLAVHIGQLSAV